MSLLSNGKPHRSLGIPEIVDVIFDSLPAVNGHMDMQALNALARTCSTFHEPAVKRLWSRLDDFRPIVGLFSKDVWRYEINGKGVEMLYPIYNFNEASRSTFTRMHHYARHVKTACCFPFWITGHHSTTIKDHGLHYTALHAIHSHPLFPQPLFPKAKELSLYSLDHYPLETIFIPAIVLSPSVQTITLIVNTVISRIDLWGIAPPHDITSESWLGLTTRIAEIAPQLSSFIVKLEDVAESLTHWAGKIPSICDALARSGFSSSLTTLDITPLVLSGPMLAVLQHLAKLDTLCISLFKFQNSELESLNKPLHFSSLSQITIETTSLPTCLTFFQRASLPRLRGLSLGCLIIVDTDLAPFFSTLHSFQNYSSVESIVLYRIYDGEANEPVWRDAPSFAHFIFTASTASSLRHYKDLTTLSIKPCTPLQLSDSALQEMLTAWPRLRAFEIDDDHVGGDYQPPLLTLVGIHQALRSVPLLERLTLAFDGSVLPDSTSPHPRLKYWDVGSSSIALSNDVAGWFIENYPSLLELEYFGAYREALRSTYCWGNVDEEDSTWLDGLHTSALMVDRWSSVSKRVSTRGVEGRR
ncbi:hypothetical protein BKA70DRAFT_404546 [Coprinopsis sp. MPI-PUGE-AT-0042]|nr:hypothetical protein BKA70DRAFT_404546 [Coprinopsis sp. MPI-PUGE-AT-0042]